MHYSLLFRSNISATIDMVALPTCFIIPILVIIIHTVLIVITVRHKMTNHVVATTSLEDQFTLSSKKRKTSCSSATVNRLILFIGLYPIYR